MLLMLHATPDMAPELRSASSQKANTAAALPSDGLPTTVRLLCPCHNAGQCSFANRHHGCCDRVADDHVFFWKGVISEPCFFDSKSLLTGVFSRNDSDLHGRMVAAFKSNVYWMQYSQCQWNSERSEQ